MPATIFWFLIVANIGLNLIHGVSLAWADYPRTMDAQKMAEVTRQVTEESGVTDLKIIAFVSAVSKIIIIRELIENLNK
jgi:hypothetical protein